MYLFLGLHVVFASLIIIGSSLPRTATLWVNDVGSLIVNTIVNTLKGVKPVRPDHLEIGEYSHKYYSYLFDDDRYKVFVGDSFQMEIKEIFPEGTDESLKKKTVNIKTSKGSDNYFICDYDIGKQNLTIYGKKEASNQFITLSVPSTNKSLTINFDVIDKQVPAKENIYVSNTSPKLGSSFYISSLFLEPYEEDIVKDGYNISKQEDYIRGGVYYNALEKNGLYYSPFSETKFRDVLDLSNHHYISDDSNIIIDEENEIVKIGEATSPGEHTITSTYGSSVSFTVLNETCSPLSISELTIESVKDIVCPEQIISSYIGQTIKLGGNLLRFQRGELCRV